MGIPKPKSKWQRFWKSTLPYDIGTALAGGGTSAASAAKFFTSTPPSPGWGYIAGGGAGVALLVQLARARSAYSQLLLKDSVHELAGCLHTLNAILAGSDIEGLEGLRSTVHAVDGDHLVQILDYVGNQRRTGTQGRKTPIHCGVIGKACREKAIFSGSRETDNHPDFLQQMVKHYGFDTERAKALDAPT